MRARNLAPKEDLREFETSFFEVPFGGFPLFNRFREISLASVRLLSLFDQFGLLIINKYAAGWL